MNKPHCCILVALSLNVSLAGVEGAEIDWLDPTGVSGTLVVAGGGSLPDAVLDRYWQAAGGKAARLVVIPTASARADQNNPIDESVWNGRPVERVTVLHTRSHDVANQESFAAPIREATGVWIGGGQQSRIADAYLGTLVEQELRALLNRGGAVGGTSAGAAIQSRVMIAGGNPMPRLVRGFDLLPDAILDQHFRQRGREPRLWSALMEHPARFGLGIDEKTAVVVSGRRIEVLGDATVSVFLAAGAGRDTVAVTMSDGEVADLTALRRAARDRVRQPFPPACPQPTIVDHGSLILGGGGRLPEAILQQFLELAGGHDSPIVVLPTAIPDPLPDEIGDVARLRKAGATNVTALQSRTRDAVSSDSFLTAIRGARGLWFGGGRQWRFVDAYSDTEAIDAMHEVLARGGVIGGSSAGASIQAEYLARGNPLGNRDIIAAGYERGFNFLAGAAVDQHFTQRDRHTDMTLLVTRHPQLLGIGIDEQTALVVRGPHAEVIGKNHVYFFDRRDAAPPRIVRVAAGEIFDLVNRRLEASPESR